MKIISLQPSITLILEHLGCLDSLAACTKYCLDAVPELRQRNLPIVHDSWSTQIDELTAVVTEACSTASGSDHAKQPLPVPPVLIIASVPYRQESLAAILKSGHPVLALAPHTLADIFTDIRLIANTLNVPEKGEPVITSMQMAIDFVRTRAKSLTHHPLVYCEEWGKPLIHSQTWVAELIEIAGGRFLGTPGTTTTPETVAAAQPDIVLAAWCGAGSRVPLEKIILQRSWQHLPAVRESRVYCIADELLNTPAPSLIQGLHALASVIHPELFGNPSTRSVRRIAPIPS
ncbi:MAG TPA: ABC transporter substrate-binding protein [Acidobacteriaceae bacterium]|nr:ABC transporter substrate-binding protein [Acidobacteriaceae bacterium]